MYWLLVIFLFVTTQMDFTTTFGAIESNPNAHEANPLVAWAVKRGKLVTFLFVNGITAFIAVFCWFLHAPGELQTSIWWLPLLGGGLFHLYLFFANRRHYGQK